MNKFYNLKKQDSRAQRFIKNPLFYKKLLINKEQFSIKNLDINTAQEDFGTCFYKNKIMFASSRENFKLTKRKWNWNNLPFLDLYIADKDSILELHNPQVFREKVNKKYHEGPASFNQAGNFMAFTRNNYKSKSKDGSIKLEIYTSEFKNNKWQKAKPVPFNNPDYSVGHPALSPDGNTMYFSSDMPGGIGGVDLYITHKDSNGIWSKPKNLGTTINTEGDEMFPFFHEKGNYLFFASDGIPGLGGFDIFIANIIDSTTFSEPANPGVPVNSNFDDFSMILNPNESAGYFSSNRPEGNGSDDIYRFDLLKPLIFDKKIIVLVKDDKGNILSDANVDLINNSKLIETIKTDTTGSHTFTITEYTLYNIKGYKEGYNNDKKNIDASTDDKSYTVNLILHKPDFALKCIAYDAETKKIIPTVSIGILSSSSKKELIKTTDKDGKYIHPLDKVKMGDRLDYNVKFQKDGYLSKSISFTKNVDHEGVYEIKAFLTKMDVGSDLGKLIDLKPIYFDLGKWNIRPDAAVELDKIVNVMNQYPKMEIELGAHTDSRGSASSNMKLSDRRAKSAANYIKKRIQNPERISGKGYGETQLLNRCKDRVPCSKAEHAINRRVEFKITKIK